METPKVQNKLELFVRVHMRDEVARKRLPPRSFPLPARHVDLFHSQNLPMSQVVRQHRRSLVDRALGQIAPAPSSAASAAAGQDSAQAVSSSPLVSVDGFRVVTTRLENLSRSAPPRGVADLVYVDAYMVASSLSRRPEVRSVFWTGDFLSFPAKRP